MAKNKRQAISVYREAGHETAADSWRTGRAVARIPRAPGGGTHRGGQGAFGNMCRKGRMFAPTKTWRKWTRQTNLTQRRFAVASALAAAALPALGMARGEAILVVLLWLVATVLWFANGVIDPEARLWSFFLVVQSMPFAAAVAISLVNALEQMRHARAVFETPAAPMVATGAMQPAQ